MHDQVTMALSPSYQTCTVPLLESLLILSILVPARGKFNIWTRATHTLKMLSHCTDATASDRLAWHIPLLFVGIFFSPPLWQILRVGHPVTLRASWGINSRHSSPPPPRCITSPLQKCSPLPFSLWDPKWTKLQLYLLISGQAVVHGYKAEVTVGEHRSEFSFRNVWVNFDKGSISFCWHIRRWFSLSAKLRV